MGSLTLFDGLVLVEKVVVRASLPHKPIPSDSRIPKNVRRGKDQRSTSNHLNHRNQPVRTKVAMTNSRNQNQLKSNHHIGHKQGKMQIADQERKRMQRAAHKG